jgi:hypothetical protein
MGKKKKANKLNSKEIKAIKMVEQFSLNPPRLLSLPFHPL